MFRNAHELKSRSGPAHSHNKVGTRHVPASTMFPAAKCRAPPAQQPSHTATTNRTSRPRTLPTAPVMMSSTSRSMAPFMPFKSASYQKQCRPNWFYGFGGIEWWVSFAIGSRMRETAPSASRGLEIAGIAFIIPPRLMDEPATTENEPSRGGR